MTALDTATVLAESFEGVKESGAPNRAELNSIMRSVLEEKPGFLSVFAEWKANALDGKDNKFNNQPGHDAAGRFIPYWNRASGPVELEPLAGPHRFLRTVELIKQVMVLDPYQYDTGGSQVQITTVLVPVEHKGGIIGTVGVDISLNTLKNEINQIELYETGYLSLISNNNRYVTNRNESLIGTAVEEQAILDGANEARETGSVKVVRDNDDSILKTGVFRVFVPVKFGKARTSWICMATVAEAKVLQRVRLTTLASTSASLVIFIIVALVILYATSGIIRPIKSVIDEMIAASAQISEMFNHLLEASTQLSQGSSEQASAIEETSSTLVEASQMLESNMDNTQQAAILAESTMEMAEKGNSSVQDMVAKISQINKSSENITKIIKLIDEIAFQTNILALNAAIEAARAGEVGLGFAVVAEEVRNLAQKSAQAAKDTASIIAGNVELTAEGVKIAQEVLRSFAAISTQARTVNDLMLGIAAASKEQSEGVAQISKSISQMEAVTQRNADNAEESSSAAEELNEQAKNIDQVVQELSRLVGGASFAPGGIAPKGKGLGPMLSVAREWFGNAGRYFAALWRKVGKNRGRR